MKKINLLYALIALLVLSNNTYAQYSVGNGDGFSYVGASYTLPLGDIYGVGNDDGFSKFAVSYSPPVTNIYRVGNDDGFSYMSWIINKWKGTTDSIFGVASNWTGSNVPSSNENILFDPSPVNHCVLDQDRTVGNIENTQSTYRLVTNGHKLTVNGQLAFTNGAQIDASATNSTLEFAGTTAQTIPNGALRNNDVYNLTINNASNVTLNGSLDLLGNITATSGRLDAVTNSPTITYAGASAQTISANLFVNNQLYNLTIDNAAGVVQDADLTVTHDFTIYAGKKHQINAAKLLTVDGTVTNNAGVGGLLLKSSITDANGSFIFPQGQTVSATVEYYSKAYWNLSQPVGSRYNWQYFGVPFIAASTFTVSPTFDGAYVRQYNEAGTGSGVNNTPVKRWLQLPGSAVLAPFVGYEIVQAAEKTYTLQGTLVNSDYNSGQLAYTSGADYPGQYVFSNPYTAAIDITALNFGTETEATVYQYNTGAFSSWDANKNGFGNLAGQYIASPKGTAGTAGIPRYIPSMQGYMIRKLHADNSSLTNFSFGIAYNSVKTKNTSQQRSKQVVKSYTEIDVTGQQFADKVWLFVDENCSRGFDNGWDGRKIMGSALNPQLFVREADAELQISAVDDINNTTLAFQPGEDSEYKIKFTHTNMDMYPELYLIDMQESKVIDISLSGSEYAFTATQGAQPANRFKIVTTTGNANGQTDITNSDVSIFAYNKSVVVNNKTNQSGVLNIVDIAGRTLYSAQAEAGKTTTFNTQLIPGSYIVVFENAEKSIRKNVILK